MKKSFERGSCPKGSGMKKFARLGLILLNLGLLALDACSAQKTVEVYNPAGIRQDEVYVDRMIMKGMAEVERYKPPLAARFPEVRIEKIPVNRDAYDEINELFYKRGWTDGLPIVPPTRERVKEMLEGTDLSPDQLIGIVESVRGKATVEKIAVNAVMAGCRPEYLPIVITVVEAITDPLFNMLGVQTTDESVAPLLIINGPIAKQLNINSSFGLLGPGWQANASIGRAIRLIMNNIGGGWPGLISQAATGHPGRYTLCFAENEEGNPWEPLHMELGYEKEINTVTVMRAESIVNVTGGLAELASVMGSLTSAVGIRHGGKVAVIVAPYVAHDLAAKGWTKKDIKHYLYENGRIPVSQFKKSWGFLNSGMPEWARGFEKEGALPAVRSPEDITVLVAGGDLSIPQHVYFPTWGGPLRITKEIKLPARWLDLARRARGGSSK
jgi:hypothetical protein